MILRCLPIALLSVLLLSACGTQAQSPPTDDQQIAAAVKAAPAPMRDAATVLGYDDQLELTTLREGEGTLICLADDPQEEEFHVACYHEALAPFMKRGRELREQGHSGAAVDSIRRAEIEEGTLEMPERPMALYNLSGPADAYDAEADSVRDASALHVIYAPYATEESMGLPTQPQGTEPWLMAPGEPWAHVMITQ